MRDLIVFPSDRVSESEDGDFVCLLPTIGFVRLPNDTLVKEVSLDGNDSMVFHSRGHLFVRKFDNEMIPISTPILSSISKRASRYSQKHIRDIYKLLED